MVLETYLCMQRWALCTVNRYWRSRAGLQLPPDTHLDEKEQSELRDSEAALWCGPFTRKKLLHLNSLELWRGETL